VKGSSCGPIEVLPHHLPRGAQETNDKPVKIGCVLTMPSQHKSRVLLIAQSVSVCTGLHWPPMFITFLGILSSFILKTYPFLVMY
jgi:hypothetical protein